MLDRLNTAIARSARWHDAAAITAIVIAVTAWFANVLFGGRLLYARDIFNYHYPMKRIVAEALRAGEWPMWSPYFAAGQPMAANPAYEVFYPPQLLVLLPDFQQGMTLHIVLHFYVCAIGLYYLLRSFGAGCAASLLGSVAYTLGGPFLSLVRTLPFLFSMAWVPLIFLFARRYLLTRSRRDLFLGALCGGMQALVAEPTTILQTWLIIAAYAGYRVYREPPAARVKLLRQYGLGVLLMGATSAAVGAAQLVPMLDFVRDSVRSQPLDWDLMIAKWSLAPARVLELFYPLVFQSLIDFENRQWISTMYNLGEPFVSSFYPGFAIGILFAAGFVAWRRGSGFVLALCAALYVLAIGAHTPLLRFLYDLGIFGTMRFPEKFAMSASLVVVIWAALTADLLFRGDPRVRRAVLYVALAWFAVGLFLILAAARVWQLFWVVTFARGVILLLFLYAIRRWRTPAWGVLLVVITAFDIVHLRSINPTITGDYFDPPPVTRQLGPEKEKYRIFHHAEWDWIAALPNADAYFLHPFGRWWTLRNSLMTRNGAWWGYRYVLDRDYDQTLLKPTERFTFAMLELFQTGRTGWEESVMAMSNAWYHGKFRDAAEEIRRTNADWQAMMPVDFLPAAERYPRYYFADHIEPVADIGDFVRKVLDGGFSRGTAFVQWSPFQPASGVVRAARETMRTMRIEAEAAGRSLLVISVTPHKYWRARIDGRPAEPLPVNVGYQALEIPAGRHVVEMEYWNPLIVPSLAVSVVALLGLIAGAVISPGVPLPAEEIPVGKPVTPPPARRKRRQRP
ncbi:MAG TPA: hypothetical protein VNA04_14820 [Thermoanaerobaculia bacterium]|nr:hypothetical protein [Thermoanaerobaculia bacterium]